MALAPAAEPAKPTPAEVEHFEKAIRPLLIEHCVKCHGEKKQSAALRLDSAAGLKKGSDTGPVVVPGDPAKSKLIQVIRRTGDNAMPPDKPLPEAAVAALTAWVKAGAYFPDAAATKLDPNSAKNHWAFQPMKAPAIPGNATHPIDAFVRSQLAEKKFAPAPEADRRTLMRRASFDLLGLPPSAEELDAFAASDAPDAYEKLLDRLLASPHFGERWARHWLDVARYSDTKGYVFQEDRNYPYAYTFRDYVVRSFNADKPISQFFVEQIAADKLPLGEDRKSLAALGFLTLGRRFLNNQADIIDDRIDVVARGMMGLTVGCARCHDHKYDPIPIADYYSLYGVFQNSTEPKELPLIGTVEKTPAYLEFEANVAKLEAAVAEDKARRVKDRLTQLGVVAGFGGFVANPDRVLNRADRNSITGLQKKVDEFRAKSPFAPPRAHVLNDAGAISEPVVFLRGNRNTPGPKVPRRMPEVVAGADRKPFTQGSGRLELANAIASPTNPLTARVFVNRVWLHLFGQGLVRTPSDFGTRSEPPTHPELLDWLALQFVRDGWSQKRLLKNIMLSATYRQSSVADAKAMQLDPENRWLARQARKRLEFEPLRDSLLVAAGQLDRTLGGKPADLFAGGGTKRRTIYGFIERQNLPGTFRAFDFASPDQHMPQRFETTVPQQALYLMNSPFVAEQARAAVARSEVARVSGPAEKAKALYRAILSRSPTAAELELALEFVKQEAPAKLSALNAWEQFAQVLMLSNEFAFVD
jgi:mono/diheme cytochrome c family protein